MVKSYVCSLCGYVYDPAAGDPQSGVAPGTSWEDVPDDWVCPLCGATKSEFYPTEDDASDDAPEPAGTVTGDAPGVPSEPAEEAAEFDWSDMEKSVICSNLARGLEKQYKPDDADVFDALARWFKTRAGSAAAESFADVRAEIDADLATRFAETNAAAAEVNDRGAMRALVWSEKVTRLMPSLLTRFPDGDIPAERNVFVCTICGFIFVGDVPPELCPICKVPDWKFEAVKARTP